MGWEDIRSPVFGGGQYAACAFGNDESAPFYFCSMKLLCFGMTYMNGCARVDDENQQCCDFRQLHRYVGL